MGRKLIARLTGTAAAVAAAALASAAGLGVASVGLGAGSATAGPCDRDGVHTTFTTGFDPAGGYRITAVVVSDINFSACAGLGLQVTLTDRGDRRLGEGGVRVSGSSVTVPIVPAVTATSVDRVHAVIAT